METRANYFLVGLFVVALCAGLLGFTIWLAKFDVEASFAEYEVVYRGSVTGLKQGGAVRFSGVNVGEVTAIRLDPKDPGNVLIAIEVAKSTPVLADTTASLEFQGLTGGRYVLLHAGSPGAGPLVARGGGRPVIQSSPSSFDQVLQGAPEVLTGINNLLARAENLLSDENADNINAILANAATLTNALAERSDSIERLLTDAASTMENLRESSVAVRDMATKLQSQSSRIGTQVEETLLAVESMAETTDTSVENVSKDFKTLTDTLNGASRDLAAALIEIRGMVAENREPIRDFTTTGLYDLSNLLIEA
ncbi:MAG TPA: MlaD family protein, partial [Kiloniellaceae bacterium]|nr:MlaD family protein [Kiloniellaceae bacterium]